ncbi:MAG: GNAT family N-acetyltransferase [Acidobacteriota bacterium]|nr:GNAT family N-acetyltransferase [Acidobacteriota bacterium]
MGEKISLAEKDEEIEGCYAVMAELRPHLTRGEFLRRVKRQGRLSGYQLAYLSDGEVKAVAGFRVMETLAWGKFMRVDDLVARGGERSKGYGGALFDWLVARAREQGCEQLHLDSRVHRFDAHRFYLRKRMSIEAHHFSLELKPQTT